LPAGDVQNKRRGDSSPKSIRYGVDTATGIAAEVEKPKKKTAERAGKGEVAFQEKKRDPRGRMKGETHNEIHPYGKIIKGWGERIEKFLNLIRRTDK